MPTERDYDTDPGRYRLGVQVLHPDGLLVAGTISRADSPELAPG